MASLAVLQAQLAALKNARASGVTLVQHGELRTQFRSIAEINTVIGAIEQDIAAAGGSQVVRSIKLTSSKDL
jgi:ribosomal protein L29